ncbi:MAG: hypothetical protein M1821_000440 [Bathelium mastoideum]|nr:MAG: hypothetical protein M1821_000440 [Bathelium mastoideum]
MTEIEIWVKDRFRALHCDENGKQCAPYLRTQFATKLKKERPGHGKAIKAAIRCLDEELFRAHVNPAEYSRAVEWAERERANYSLKKNGKLRNRNAVISVLASLDIYLHPKLLEDIIKRVPNREAADVAREGQQNVTAERRKTAPEAPTTLASPSEDPTVRAAASPANTSDVMSNAQLREWIYQQYLERASQPGFKADGFAKSLVPLKPDKKKKIYQTVAIVTELQDNSRLVPEYTPANEADAESKSSLQQHQLAPSSRHASTDTQPFLLQGERVDDSSREDSTLLIFARSPSSKSSIAEISSDSIEDTITTPNEIDYTSVHLLQANTIATEADKDLALTDEDIKHAPLISADIIDSTDRNLLPQVGFLGTHVNNPSSPQKPLFLNTNIPFSAFVCGVQGSGKSHTVSCFLGLNPSFAENALIPSRHLGRLKKPLSALVFNYGKFNSAFKISEAAFLAAPHPAFSAHPAVKKITVLVSPSNPAIAKLYNRIPNVRVLPFKLKSHTLDINTMLTLMAVDESANPPLYLASVTKILRQMAMEGSGEFKYSDFKARLKLCQFNPSQLNMLELRLGLLESFLDLNNSCQEPEFSPGEVTIMDMSCPFIDANTACILFSIGLHNYLQSRASGKLIVLDEAHKYMLNVPGAKSLNEDLMRIIRMQRHYGARVVISTQEPVFLTELIALCSIAVVHRFSSPEWLNALKKHIPVLGENKHNFLQEIESLRTGTALVYSSNAVLGKNENGDLLKGTSRLLEVNVRKRVTADGGQSVLSVDNIVIY